MAFMKGYSWTGATKGGKRGARWRGRRATRKRRLAGKNPLSKRKQAIMARRAAARDRYDGHGGPKSRGSRGRRRRGGPGRWWNRDGGHGIRFGGEGGRRRGRRPVRRRRGRRPARRTPARRYKPAQRPPRPQGKPKPRGPLPRGSGGKSRNGSKPRTKPRR